MTDLAARPRILLVEDNDLNRALVRSILARAKHPLIRQVQLTEAPDLATARTALAAAPVDVVLLDMQLPDGSGTDLAQELAELPDGLRPAVVALTAAVLPEQQASALRTCDAFLAKPHTPDDLVNILLAHLPPIPVES